MMEMADWEQLRSRLRPGLVVSISSASPIYEGPYSSEILCLIDEGLRINMPLESGRLVLVPVGTEVRVSIPEANVEVCARVVDRRGGRERYLELSLVRAPEVVQPPEDSNIPVVSITSGKGGVGKSTLVINLAIAFAELGKRACVIDADLGTANVDVLLNISPPFNLGDVVNGSKHMVEVLTEGPHGMLVLPGGSGLRQLLQLHDAEFTEIINQFRSLEAYADLILIDTGSGVSSAVTNFVSASSSAILVTTPEPHSITDAYALLKVLAERGERVPMHLIANRVHSGTEAKLTADRMVYAARRFLQYEVEPIGFIREDPMVSRSVRKQVPVLTEYPRTKAALDIRTVAESIANAVGLGQELDSKRGGTGAFLRRFRSLLPSRNQDEAFRA